MRESWANHMCMLLNRKTIQSISEWPWNWKIIDSDQYFFMHTSDIRVCGSRVTRYYALEYSMKVCGPLLARVGGWVYGEA